MAVILPVECIRDQVSASFASTSANLYTSIPRSCFGEGKIGHGFISSWRFLMRQVAES